MIVSNKLGVIEFGQLLIKTKDLDPLYVALYKSGMSRERLCEWLVAYWCYYHAGLCCWIVEQPDYYEALMRVAQGGSTYPRGTERRHFRGEMAVKAVSKLGKQFMCAESLVDWLIEAGPRADKVMTRVKTLYGFGEWICWKVPDMIERLGLAPLQFIDRDVDLMFPSVQKGALEVSALHAPGDDPLMRAHRYVLGQLRSLRAPPSYDRGLNVQETETVFCKWKSHLGGHYPLGKDTHEIGLGLLRYSHCRTAQRLYKTIRELKGAKV